jgi:uncharacterized protein (DUF2252 family)
MKKSEKLRVFRDEKMRRLATMLRCRDDDADVRLLDAAYWLKGCSSLGRLRYAVLLEVEDKKGKYSDYCLMDVKGAAQAAAPRAKGVTMPSDQGDRVVEGARHLSPYLGERGYGARRIPGGNCREGPQSANGPKRARPVATGSPAQPL